MERAAWLQEKRRLAKERYDTMFAKDFDEHWGHINPSHRQMLERFLALCPPQAQLLDAACGTGKYWPIILAGSWSVLGIDQSRQMLLRARAKFPDVPTEKCGLQELNEQERFDGIICMDAMENVFPEDWALVLSNFYRALKPAGLLYFTVEIETTEAIHAAFLAGQQMGLPLIHGEWAHEGGYHYYPSLEQVRAWTQAAGFTILEETEGDGYQHFLTRKEEN